MKNNAHDEEDAGGQIENLREKRQGVGKLDINY